MAGFYDWTTGKLRAPMEPGVLSRDAVPHAPSVADKAAVVHGYKDEKFSLLNSGAVCEFLVDVPQLSADTVSNLVVAGKIKYIAAFVGAND